MTIQSTDTIDLVVASPDATTLCLIIVVTEQLTKESGHLDQLAAKLRTYHQAITSGFVNHEYPDYAKAAKIIRVEHYTTLSSGAEEILANWGKQLSFDGIRLLSLQNSFNPFKILVSLFSKKDKTRKWTS